MLRSLHSNLVLFKFCRCLDVVKESVLYIPIWFYSNLFLIKSATTSIIFTFQSGSIQIIPFFTIKSNILTLHSNLVLFKCMMPFCFDIKESLYIPIWFYSNLIQVQILAMAISALHSNLVLFKLRHRTEKSTQLTSFTFQSGSIQIVWYNCTYMISKLLYIPIWLYSNLGSAPSVSDAHKSLHSNLVIFK